jgi:DNA-directed RNA polymerase specialized sigma24 family protein
MLRPVRPTSRRIDLADGLNQDWRRLARDPVALGTAAGWCLGIGPIDDLDDLLDHVGYGRPVDDAAGDRALAVLVRLAAEHELAARVVLQRILPGLIRVALRRGRIVPGGPSVAFAELASAAWLTICSYPIARRPHRVAANLLRDIEYHAFVRSDRKRSRELRCGDVEEAVGESLVTEPDIDLGARHEWGELIAWATRRGVDPAQVELLVQLARGRSSAELAVAMQCSDRTVRNRRDVALVAVRRAHDDVAA